MSSSQDRRPPVATSTRSTRAGRAARLRTKTAPGEVASSAAYADGIVFVSSEDAFLSAIDIGGHVEQPKVLWRWDDALPDAASPLAKDGYVILPTGFGVVSCLDAKTGKLRWEKEFDRGFWSSPSWPKIAST